MITVILHKFYFCFFTELVAHFNLIPIPPLDGSHFFKYILPQELRRSYENLGRTGAGFTPNGRRSKTDENR